MSIRVRQGDKLKMKASKDLKIALTGTGYVGLSIATLLIQHRQVTAKEKVYTRDIFQRD